MVRVLRFYIADSFSYERNDGKKYTDSSDINFSALKDVTWLSSSGVRDVVRSIKDVGKGVVNLTKTIKTYGESKETDNI